MNHQSFRCINLTFRLLVFEVDFWLFYRDILVSPLAPLLLSHHSSASRRLVVVVVTYQSSTVRST